MLLTMEAYCAATTGCTSPSHATVLVYGPVPLILTAQKTQGVGYVGSLQNELWAAVLAPSNNPRSSTERARLGRVAVI